MGSKATPKTKAEEDEELREAIRGDCAELARLRNVPFMDVLRLHREVCFEAMRDLADVPEYWLWRRRADACDQIEVEGLRT